MRFKDIAIAAVFHIARTGQPMRKLSDTTAVGIMPEPCGFDWQELKEPAPSEIWADERVY